MGNIEEITCCQTNSLINDSELSSNKKYIRQKKIISHNSNQIDFNSTIESSSTSDLPKNIFTIKSITMIQSHIRKFLLLKKLNENLEVLSNIISLDQTVNLIKNSISNSIIEKNKGEILNQKLISEKKIIPYKETEYYKKNIIKYPKSKYLLYTPLTYIDKFKNEDTYIGTWTLERKFLGYGILYSKNNKYEGFWNFGKLNGEIRYFLSNGDYFIGNFINGKANGDGKLYLNNGNIYIGNFFNNKKDGFGKFFWSDDNFYEGYWKDDKQNGKGKLVNKDLVIEGNWVNGIFNNEKIKNENNININLTDFNINDDINSDNLDLNINDIGKDENMFNLNLMENFNFENDEEEISETDENVKVNKSCKQNYNFDRNYQK